MEDRVAMVSGVGPGLGRSIALACAREGADVALVARSAERLAVIADEVEAAGQRALPVSADITDEAACAAIVAQVTAAFGRIDLLANNAFSQPPFETLEDQSMEVVKQSFDINLFAHLQLTKAVVPTMRAQGGGAVVMTNSSILRRARTYFGAYKMAKHALLALARSLAEELGADGIRVNSIAPGYIYDEPVKFYFHILAERDGRNPADVEAEITAGHPLGHIPTPAEIADVVVLLGSDLARAVTGQCIDVNAGEFMV